MKAVCPRCKKDLEDSAGSSRELALPVFGSSSSGKTQLLAATALALQGTVDRAGGAVEPADDYSRTWFRHVADLHSRGGSVTKTTAASQHATSLRLVSGKSRLLVKMFDAAGENFLSPDKIRELQYLRGGGTLVFVLDPLSLPVLWNGLDDDRRSRLGPIRASGSPRDVFQATVQTLHQISIDTRRIRLAVVVSKADVIGPEIERWHVGDDGSIRDWLAGAMQQDNLIRNVEHEFASARFFLTDATLGGRKLHPSIETLASWLLTGEGMRL